MNPNQLSSLPLRLERLFYGLQDRIMSDVVRRIRKTGDITSTADYQLNKMLLLGNSTEFIETEIQRMTGMSDAELWELYDRVIDADYTRQKSLYEQVNSNFIPYAENDTLQQWTEAVISQTKNDLRNITNSLGFTVDMGWGKKAFTPLSEYYQRYLDRACLDVVTGSFDYNSVLRRVVKEMTASGLQTVDYASGYTSRAPVAARRALLTGVHQLTAQMNEKIAQDLHTEYFEVTAHAGARPSHAVWQGRVYPKRDLEDICGLGSVGGLCGANCRHSYYAFIPGVSVRAYTDAYLKDLQQKDAAVRVFNGKQYDGYEAAQRQRQYETTMRAQRANIKQLKAGGAAQEDVQAAQTRYLATLHEYQRFSSTVKLPEQMERVYVDGLGRMAGGRIPTSAKITGYSSVKKSKTIAKSGGSGILGKTDDKGNADVHIIGKIDRKIYSCVTKDIVTDEVIITDERIEHIIQRRGQAFYDKYGQHLSEVIESPDYIFEDQENTALVCKRFENDEKYINVVLRIVVSTDNPEYKNSIITAVGENEKRFKQRLRNKKLLYKKE